jgi:hypothetical protein
MLAAALLGAAHLAHAERERGLVDVGLAELIRIAREHRCPRRRFT